MKSIDELQHEQLSRLHWADLFTLKCADGDKALDVWEEAELAWYFQHFLPPGRCVMCGAKQGGDLMDSLMGTARFQWGMAHGEGQCSDCGYPARAYHRNIGPIKFVEVILQYHPNELKSKRNPAELPISEPVEAQEAAC